MPGDAQRAAPASLSSRGSRGQIRAHTRSRRSSGPLGRRRWRRRRTIYIGKGEKFAAGAMKALPAGSFIVMPPNTPHFAMAKEEAEKTKSIM